MIHRAVIAFARFAIKAHDAKHSHAMCKECNAECGPRESNPNRLISLLLGPAQESHDTVLALAYVE